MKDKTILWCWKSFYKQTYTTLGQIEDEIEECDHMINYYKATILNLIMTTDPKLWGDEENQSIPESFSNMIGEYNYLIENLIVNISVKSDLEEVKEKWFNCHDKSGLALDNTPFENSDTTAFIRVEKKS